MLLVSSFSERRVSSSVAASTPKRERFHCPTPFVANKRSTGREVSRLLMFRSSRKSGRPRRERTEDPIRRVCNSVVPPPLQLLVLIVANVS